TQIDRNTKQQRLEEVKFKPKTYLSEILQKNSRQLPGPEINPNELRSSARKQAIEQLELFAPTQAPLLILGERGVGKSTLVRKHVKERLFPDLAYRELACGTFREELFRSELFGYKKGAFTGANTDKTGILDIIGNGGILFLDEIQDLSLNLQRELIQVLQTGEFYPIGSDAPQQASFRLIVATNQHPGELLARGTLSPDFFDRVAHLCVEIPPLRECREDLPQWWENVWKTIAHAELDVPWNADLEELLATDSLSGNFRDLQRLAAHLYAYLQATPRRTPSQTKQATKAGIAAFRAFNARLVLPSARGEGYFRPDASFREMERNFRQDLVNWAIQTYGDIKTAALVLKRKESTLYQDKRGSK
ncbi:MAG: sigma 54-interacting transcriptional regulator, partial [Bacteroidota bacterium]